MMLAGKGEERNGMESEQRSGRMMKVGRSTSS